MRGLVTGALAIALVVGPSAARAEQGLYSASAALVGLPVFTSDGREIGRITEVVRQPREPMLLAEIERPGGNRAARCGNSDRRVCATSRPHRAYDYL